jgi:RNA polymerase sigma-70 factor (ECF subfamily)
VQIPPTDLSLLAKLFEEYRPRLVAMVRRRLDHALAPRLDEEDVVNDAFLLACRKWPAFERRSPDATYAWLYGVVRDCLTEAWRRETRERRDPRRELRLPEQSSAYQALGLASANTSPSAAAMRDEDEQKILEALKELTEGDRGIIRMRHFDCLSIAETAAVLQISPSAAAVRYVRAMQRLRRVLPELCAKDGPY